MEKLTCEKCGNEFLGHNDHKDTLLCANCEAAEYTPVPPNDDDHDWGVGAEALEGEAL